MKAGRVSVGKWLMLLIAAALVLTLGAYEVAGRFANLPRSVEEDNIREVVFRHQFDHNASGLQKNAAVYCLSVGADHGDPSDDFIRRFDGHTPPVRKASQCEGRFGVTDKETGKPSLKFSVSTVTWISDSGVEVEGGYYEGGSSASGNTYEVAKKWGRWRVSKDTMKWIS